MCWAEGSNYDYYEGYVKGIALLRSLLLMRIRLKKLRPGPQLLWRYLLKLKLSGHS